MLISRWEIPPGYLRTTESSISASASIRVYMYARTLALNRHTHARALVYAFKYVCLDCVRETTWREAAPLSSVSCKSSQIVAAVSGGSNDGSVPVPVCEAVYFATRTYRRDYSIAPAVRACCDFIKSHLRRGMTRRRVKISRWNLSRWLEFRIYRGKNSENINVI